MMNLIVIILAALLLPVLLYGEKRENSNIIVPFKTALSALFIVAVLIQPHPVPRFFTFLLLGLIFCLFGDFFLALPREKMFLLGLISFLLGHVLYIIAFFSAGSIESLSWTGVIVVLVAGCSIFFWLKPHLGPMKIPVLLYIIVISVMFCGAMSLFGNKELEIWGRVFVIVGAAFFYISDIFVAKDRFLKKNFVNRLLGLPLYYLGQFLLAFSAGLLR
jgi:uncharacterized membrane protein YhhN